MNDTTALFLDAPSDRDVAYLACLDNAIGDWILLADIEHIDSETWRAMLSSAASGNDVVIEMSAAAKTNTLYGRSRQVFSYVYRFLTSFAVLDPPPLTRLYSRSAAVYLLNRREGDMLLKCAGIGSAFPVKIMRSAETKHLTPSRNLADAMSKAWRVINQSSAFPAKTATIIAIVAALLNLLYAGYAIVSYLVLSDIAPGWATQSLQISGMFFLTFCMLAILSENISAISRSVGHRVRYTVVRELRSRRSNSVRQLNVVTSDMREKNT